MRKSGIVLTALLLILNSCLLTGCWNYREIDKMAIVAGAAVDKGKEKKYEVTAEIIKVTGGPESKTESQTLSSEGDTIFDAVRNIISVSGERLYWSHGKVIILSQEISKEGIISILDWYNRDAETRGDVNILVSKAKTAKEILISGETTENIKSFMLDDTLDSEKSLSKAPHTETKDFINELAAEGMSNTAPIVEIKEEDNKKTLMVSGAAIFKGDKLIGFLEEEETKAMLFVKDQVEGGVLVAEGEGETGAVPVTLEIFKNKTKVKPLVSEGNIEMVIEIDLQLAIDEIQGFEDFMEEDKVEKLEKETGRKLKEQIETMVKKVQSESGADIFGFGVKVHSQYHEEWEKMKKDWEKHYKEIKVTVNPKILIRNSAMLAEPLELGD